MDSLSTTKEVGICVVYGRSDNSLVLGQIKFHDLSFSGIWDTRDFKNDDLSFAFYNHIAIGNKRGKHISDQEFNTGSKFRSLEKLIINVKTKYESLTEIFEKYLQLNPKKISTLSALPTLKWPDKIDLDKPSLALGKLNKSYGPLETPKELIEMLSLMKLTSHVLENWRIHEEQRISKKYLGLNSEEVTPYPRDWLE